MRWILCALTLLVLFSVSAAPVQELQRSYNPRACGFDMDDDGIWGEPEDCNVCDGVTADPDNDGNAEDLLYVDCDAATNGDGSPGNPHNSIIAAFANADGPGDGAEDIVCFTGTCAPDSLRPTVDGLTTTKTRPAAGSEARDFILPSNPAMIVGWDKDNDAEYPPYDTDDVSVMDGTGLYRAIDMRGAVGDHFEFAHFTAKDYGRQPGSNGGGFYAVGRPYNYLHDISLVNINREMPGASDRIVFHMFHASGAEYTYVHNLEVLHYGGFFTRGGGGTPTRFQNLHLTQHPADHTAASVAKLWGYVADVEYLDSKFEGQPWLNEQTSHPSTWPRGIVVGQCAQNFLIRNNEFVDIYAALIAQGHASGYCDGSRAREVDDVVFDGNIARYTHDEWSASFVVITSGGNDSGENVGDIAITNNVFLATDGGKISRCLLYSTWNDNFPIQGTVTYVNNTCIGQHVSAGSAGIYVGASPGRFHHENWVVRDNTFGGFNYSSDNMYFKYAPSNFQSDNNNYDGDGNYYWNGQRQYNLADWQAATGEDANSQECAGGCSAPPSCHWADSDCNGDISISELVTVVLDWQSGSRTISELVDVVLLWQA